jgi:hypothetical protein
VLRAIKDILAGPDYPDCLDPRDILEIKVLQVPRDPQELTELGVSKEKGDHWD